MNAVIEFGRLSVVPLLIAGLLYFGSRAYHKRTAASRIVIRTFLLFAFFLLASSIAALFGVRSLLAHIIGLSTMHYAGLTAYIAIERYMEPEKTAPLVRHPLFLPVTLLTLMSLLIDSSEWRVGGFPNFLDDVPDLPLAP